MGSQTVVQEYADERGAAAASRQRFQELEAAAAALRDWEIGTTTNVSPWRSKAVHRRNTRRAPRTAAGRIDSSRAA